MSHGKLLLYDVTRRKKSFETMKKPKKNITSKLAKDRCPYCVLITVSDVQENDDSMMS